MFTKPNMPENELLARIESLRGFFTQQEQQHFKKIWADTMSAVDEFRNVSGSSAVFIIGPDKHTRDAECRMDFTGIGTYVNQLSKADTRPKRLSEAAVEFPRIVARLKNNLTSLLDADMDQSRKSTYQNAAEFLTSIEKSCFLKPNSAPKLPENFQ